MGNLGWDTPAADLKARADEIVQLLGMTEKLEGEFQPVVGRDGTGSCAEAFFRRAEDVELYKIKLRAQGKSFMAGRQVWLDHKKTREQLRPARTIHRGAECLEDLERSRPDGSVVYKDLARRTLSVAGSKAFWFCNGSLRATVWGAMRYTADEIDMITEYANTE